MDPFGSAPTSWKCNTEIEPSLAETPHEPASILLRGYTSLHATSASTPSASAIIVYASSSDRGPPVSQIHRHYLATIWLVTFAAILLDPSVPRVLPTPSRAKALGCHGLPTGA